MQLLVMLYPQLFILLLLANITLSAWISPPSYLALATPPPIFCYDSRYASHHPALEDCAAIINQQIGQQPHMSKLRVFSHHPTDTQLLLPHTWRTDRQQCNVTIDIPVLWPSRSTAQASMDDIKRASFEVLVACVLRDEHLGGFTQAGKRGNLQVRIEAGEPVR